MEILEGSPIKQTISKRFFAGGGFSHSLFCHSVPHFSFTLLHFVFYISCLKVLLANMTKSSDRHMGYGVNTFH